MFAKLCASFDLFIFINLINFSYPHGSAMQPTNTDRALCTSEDYPIHVDFLPARIMPLSGLLGMTIAPGKRNQGMRFHWHRNLQQDLARLRHDYGTHLLVTLLEAEEMVYLQIADLLQTVPSYGMRSQWFPIPDFGIPSSMTGLISLVETILAALEGGRTTVVHCRAGLGRSGLVIASCLVALGYSPKEAFAQVRASRPGSVETLEQETYVYQFAEVWKQNKSFSHHHSKSP
jgi:protein-tyrosine phosphatase